jgi:hypothetical protein
MRLSLCAGGRRGGADLGGRSAWLWLAPAVEDDGGHAISANRQQDSQWILPAGWVLEAGS